MYLIVNDTHNIGIKSSEYSEYLGIILIVLSIGTLDTCTFNTPSSLISFHSSDCFIVLSPIRDTM